MQRSPRRTAQQWESLVKEQQASGLSAPKYCKDHHVSYASFSKWRKQLTESEPDLSQDTPPVFVELTQAQQSPVHQWAAELDFGTGIVLRIAKA